jgi:hypothetical protein
VHSAFIFDGTQSNITDIWSGTSHNQMFDTSAWVGQNLVVSTTWRGPVAPPRLIRKRTMWLDADGTLIVETSEPVAGTGVWSTTRSRYRRVGGHHAMMTGLIGWPANRRMEPTRR